MAERQRAAVSGRQIGLDIAQALGLVSTRHITIDIPLDGAVTVTVQYYPTAEEVAPLAGLLQQYRLFPQTPIELASEVDRLRDAMAVFAEYGVSVQPQFQQIMRERLDRSMDAPPQAEGAV
jgi:hypothetical protein